VTLWISIAPRRRVAVWLVVSVGVEMGVPKLVVMGRRCLTGEGVKAMDTRGWALQAARSLEGCGGLTGVIVESGEWGGIAVEDGTLEAK
jgi:hypothetical protein